MSKKSLSGTSWKEMEGWAKMPREKAESAMRVSAAKDTLRGMGPRPKSGEAGYDDYMQKVREAKAMVSARGDTGAYQNRLGKMREEDKWMDSYRNRPGYAKHYDLRKWIAEQQGLQEKAASIRRANEVIGSRFRAQFPARS